MKKFLIITVLSIIMGSFFVPATVFAQKSYCWTKDSCEKAGGVYAETAKSKGECIQSPVKYNYCFPKETPVKLQVNIGTLTHASSLTQYIPAIYNYLVSIVSIVAIIMVMIGGLRYLTAGGNPSAISSAKETILGAVIGLFLTLGSYTILQTINPALTTLSLPPVKMVAPQSLAQWCPNNGDFQGKFQCGTKYTSQSTPTPPINSGYCIGSACEQKNGVEYGCNRIGDLIGVDPDKTSIPSPICLPSSVVDLCKILTARLQNACAKFSPLKCDLYGFFDFPEFPSIPGCIRRPYSGIACQADTSTLDKTCANFLTLYNSNINRFTEYGNLIDAKLTSLENK